MNILLLPATLALLFFVIPSDVYAHTAMVLDDFKIDVGWEDEPPVKNQENAIEVVISIASSYDKQRYDTIYGNVVGEKKQDPGKEDVSSLIKELKADVEVGSSEKSLTLEPAQDFAGLFRAKYTPSEAGDVKINLYGIINGLEFGATFHPEKVDSSGAGTDSTPAGMVPTWVKNNAGWWAEGQITDNDFLKGIEYLVKEEIIRVTASGTGGGAEDEIPEWIKNNAGWWAEGQITDNDFLKGIEYLVNNGIISV